MTFDNNGFSWKTVYSVSFSFIVLASLISGCAYRVQLPPIKAINANSLQESKIPGRFAVVIDDSIRKVNREVKPISFVCHSSTYNIAFADSLTTVVKDTFDSIFEQTVEMSTMPSDEEMTKLNLRGAVLLKMGNFSPKLTCSWAFYFAPCSGITDISLVANIRGLNGSLFETTVTGSKTFDGSAGHHCAGGADALAVSIAGATEDVLKNMAKRISNLPMLRQASNK